MRSENDTAPRIVKAPVLVAVFAVALLASSCSSKPRSSQSSDAPTKVFATMPVFAEVASAATCTKVDSIIPAGPDLHDYEPSLRKADEIGNAEIVFAVGLGLEANLEKFLTSAEETGVAVVELGPSMDPMSVSEASGGAGGVSSNGGHGGPVVGSVVGSAPGAAAAAVGAAGTALSPAANASGGPLVGPAPFGQASYPMWATHEDHDHGEDEEGDDPHVWMDPVRMKMAVSVIRQTFIDHGLGSDKLDDCVVEYNRRLDAANDKIVGDLGAIAPEERVVAASHDAYSYYADRYGLDIVTTLHGVSHSGEISAKELEAFRTAAADGHARALLVEEGSRDEVAEAVANDLGMNTVELYEMPTSSVRTYIEMLEVDTDRIVAGLR